MSDIWLLDVRTRRWRRLPGMPLITALKAMSMAWTADGRLLLAGSFDRFGDGMASWRPGQQDLELKRLPLPRSAGSDSFVPWPAGSPSLAPVRRMVTRGGGPPRRAGRRGRRC